MLFVLKATNPMMLSEFYLAGKLKAEDALSSDSVSASKDGLCSQSIALRLSESLVEKRRVYCFDLFQIYSIKTSEMPIYST